ncbi:MAG: lysophospholipid acyltransferase family protein [Gammaproteobacteria bacterium]
MKPKSILFWPYQLYAWLFFIPFACLWSFLCGWAAVLVATVGSQRAASHYVGKTWARVLGWLTPIRVTVEGADRIDPSQTYVVVSNHVSQYDIIVIYGWLMIDLRWVMKQELRKLPGIGPACEKVGHIIVDRRNPESARRSLNEALARIGDGIGILFFPEGTRSLDGRLKPFKKGAFRIALDEQLPVLPITLLGTRDILPAKTLKLFPGRARIVIHPAIEPAPGGDLRALMETARDAIASALPEERAAA